MSSQNIENNKKSKDRDEVTGTLLKVEEIVTNGKPTFHKKMVTTDTNVSKGKDIINTKKARKKAWNLKAKIKRKISKEVRKNLGM
jgi:hypothetical protein